MLPSASSLLARHRFAWLLLALACVFYALVTLHNLDTFPPVGQDEPWIAAAPHKLATQGVYGSDLFEGYYGSEKHLFQLPPVYPLLQAALFKLGGPGVLQMRLLPALLGLLLLILVFLVGWQLGGPPVALLAMGLFLWLRLGTGWDETGIPLLDLARISRYDIAVPVFGLAALLLFNHAAARKRPLTYLLVGGLVGLASLSHLYGAFWLPAFVLVLFHQKGRSLFRQKALYLLLAGFVVMWLPWLAYIASGWEDFQGQRLLHQDRFAVFSFSFYAENLLNEYRRYRALVPLDTEGTWHPWQFGPWVAVFGVPVALVALLRQRHRAQGRPFAVAVAALTQGLLFALLLKMKMYNYLIALWPLATIALAWFGVRLWSRSTSRPLRWILLLILGLMLTEGTARLVHRHTVAQQTSSYRQFGERIAAFLPSEARVLGLQHYWMGLPTYTYRTWLLPIMLADSTLHHAPVSLDQALERVQPDYILMDRYMAGYFAEIADPENPRHPQYLAFQRYLARHQATVIGRVDDATYGTLRILHISPLDSTKGEATHPLASPSALSSPR